MRTELVDRSIAAIAAHTQRLLLAEEFPARSGFLQAVSPAIKLVGLGLLISVTVGQDDPFVLCGLAALSMGLAIASRVPVRTIGERVVPPAFLALVVVAPQVVLMGGATLSSVPLSVAGISYVGIFSLRVATCVAFLSLLLLTTRFRALLAGIDRLRAPPIVVSLLAITYRYLFLSFGELERMVRARRSRTIANHSLSRTWRDSGSLVGTFFLRSLERGERVQRAARARGGPGPVSRDTAAQFGFADLAFGLIAFTAALGVMMI